MLMLETGDADAVLCGIESDYPETIRPALQVIDLKPGIHRIAGLYAMIRADQVFMFADTTVNVNPTAEELAEIALSAADVAHAFDIEPRIAMLSFSNFGSSLYPESRRMAEATAIVQNRAPHLMIDGEMQADTALLPELLNRYYSFSRLKQSANVFIFPDLNSGNIAYKLVQRLGNVRAVGPILMGLSKPVHVLHRALEVNEVVDMAAIAVVDAQNR
jgi:malate dehydrogenase (oxaloacetate-decarboxylating)(NADP+)